MTDIEIDWDDCHRCGDYIPIETGIGSQALGMRLCDTCKETVDDGKI